MDYSFCLIFLALIPLGVFQHIKKRAASYVWTCTGLAFGLVIAPLSQGLVEYTAVPVVGAYIGLIGAIFNLIHGSVGFLFLGALGVFSADTVLTSSQLLLMNMVNGVIWTGYYGFVGHKFDLKFSPKGQGIYIMVTRHQLKHDYQR